jgi:hypothetical protein
MYFHKGHPWLLAIQIFTLLLAGITNAESKYYNKTLLYNQFSTMGNLADLGFRKNGALVF